MKPKCKFCQKKITTDHYGITKHGSICLKCIRRTKNALGNITDVSNSSSAYIFGRGKKIKNG